MKKSILELMGLPCKKPAQVRSAKGVCVKPTQRASQPDVWAFSEGRWRKISQVAKVSVSQKMGCPSGTRYSPRVKDEAKRCVVVKKHEGPRKPRTNCKSGFSEATGRCIPAKKMSVRASDPAYMLNPATGRYVKKVEKVKAPVRSVDPAYKLNPATGRYILKVRPVKVSAHPCPPGERFYSRAFKGQGGCKAVAVGPRKEKCPKGEKRSKATGDCYAPMPRFMKFGFQ